MTRPKSLRCYRDGWHPDHRWVNGGVEVACDGLTPTEPKPNGEPERPCCGDPLCPCHGSHPGWSTDSAGSMNYPDLTPTTHSHPGSNGDTP